MNTRVGLCLFLAGLLSLGVCPSGLSAQTDLPEMELRVTGIQGSPEINPGDTDAWKPLEVDTTLQPGDRIRTGDDEIIKLEIPSVTYSRVTESSLIEVQKLERTEEERGLLTTNKVIVNDIQLNEIEGKIQNSVKKHEGVSTDYTLQTPNAVAGIRGTDFQCEVTTFGETKCAVLEGEVRFSSRRNPEAKVNLSAGQQSSIGAEESRPQDPSGISEETRQELQKVKNQAESALRLKPTLSSFSLNGTSFKDSIRIAYTKEVKLTLSGQATAREAGAEIVEVNARISGEDLQVSGESSWSFEFTPDVPAKGESRTLEITLRAIDTNESRSKPRTLTVTLVNSEEKASEGLPSGYESGQVEVRLTSLAGNAPGDVDFPYYLYRADASEEGITLRGEASADAPIENVAYSLDGGKTWKRATGAENWTVNLPTGQAWEHTVQVRAWTTDGVIGSPVEIGPLHYQPISYETAIRQSFAGFWTAFEKQDPQRAVRYIHPDFLFEAEQGSDGPDGESEGPRDKQEFKDFLRNQLKKFVNLRVFYSINTVFGSPGGGTLKADPIEWNLKSEFNNRYFPAAVTGNGDFKFKRTSDGIYRLLEFKDFSPEFFIGFDRITMNDTDGYFRGSAKNVKDNKNLPKSFEADAIGYLIAGLDIDNAPWPGNPPHLYVNPDPVEYDNPHSWCGCNNGEIIEGGIYETPYSSFSEVQSIKRVESSTYQNKEELKVGSIYAVNLKTKDGKLLTYLLEVTDLRDNDSDPKIDEIQFRVVTPGDASTRIYNGANPFE